MRSLLFVPGHRERMVEKALGIAVLDVAILDLEDGVPSPQRDAARRIIAAALDRPRTDGPRRFVRINRAGTSDHDADLDAIGDRADGVLLSKVERAEEVAEVVRRLVSVPVIAAIETARGLLNAPSIAASSPALLLGLMFGTEDFASDLGLPAALDADARELVYARSAVVVAAAAAGVDAYDGVWPEIGDLEGLRREAEAARRLGFRGKSLIHPSHIAVVNEVFAPRDDELAWARRVVEAASDAEREGRAAIALDGRLVDPPVVARAKRTLET